MSVIFDMSMSLDGYVTATSQTPEMPVGDGGLRLMDWIGPDDEIGNDVLRRGVDGLGAVICGRRTYDTSVPWWGANGPSGEARRPVFVVSHSAAEPPEDGVYTFATGGIEDALAQAREAAGDRYVTVMGGPAIGNQFLRAGLIDELSIHLVPVLFGDGTRLTEALPEHIQLEPLENIDSPNAAHLRYRVVRPG